MRRSDRTRPGSIAGLILCGMAMVGAVPGHAADAGKGVRSPTGFLINDGDSLLAINGGPPPKTSMDFLDPSLKAIVGTANVSLSGETLAHMLEAFPQHVAARYSPDFPVFVVHVLGGGNDVRAGASADAIYAVLRSYVGAVHALGPHTVALVSTYPLQCNILRNPAQLTVVHRLNDMVSAGWQKPPETGGLGADGLVDYFADPTIGANTYANSSFCDPAWSNDGAHLNERGKAVLGGIESRAVARAVAAP